MPTRRKSIATPALRSGYDFPEPPIGFVWQNGSPRRHEGTRRNGAACAKRSQIVRGGFAGNCCSGKGACRTGGVGAAKRSQSRKGLGGGRRSAWRPCSAKRSQSALVDLALTAAAARS